MIKSTIEAIAVALNEEFGEKYRIYGEQVKQDLKEPCFFIFTLNPAQEQFLGKRYQQTNPFVIQYIPESKRQVEGECNDVAARLYGCLEYITPLDDDRPIRGTKMKYEIVDNVLHFFVNYDGFIRKVEKEEVMQTMKSDVTTR